MLWNAKYDTWVSSCFNCDHVSNFQSFSKFVNPSVYESYHLKEKEHNLNDFISSKNNKNDIIVTKKQDDISLELLPQGCIPCKENNDCLNYLKKRKIPQRFFNKWKYHKSHGLIVPFEYDDDFVYGWQGRRLTEKVFRTSLPEKNPKIWNWYNIDKNVKTYITESIIDACMLYHINEQAIAAVGADIKPEYVNELSEPIFIFDNDKTGRKKTLKYSKIFPNAKFLYWDRKIKQKDLNEIFMSGIKKDKFSIFIDKYIMTSLEIQVRLKLDGVENEKQ